MFSQECPGLDLLVSLPLHRQAPKGFSAGAGCFGRDENDDGSACLTSDQACVTNAMAFATGDACLPQQGPGLGCVSQAGKSGCASHGHLQLQQQSFLLFSGPLHRKFAYLMPCRAISCAGPGQLEQGFCHATGLDGVLSPVWNWLAVPLQQQSHSIGTLVAVLGVTKMTMDPHA